MILRRKERDRVVPIGDHEQRELFALHEFLDENLAARFAERAVLEHRVDRRLSVGRVFCDDDALSRREPGGFDDDG